MNCKSLLLASLTVLVMSVPAWADPAVITTSLSDVGIGAAYSENHYDGEPFKGSVTVNVTNNSDVAWGDFHFQIFSIGQSVALTDFVATAPDLLPTSTQSGLTWAIDNAPVTGSTMDLYYYSDPVGIGETATFKVYTDNTASKVNFGVMFWATPVPEPVTMSFLGLGLAGLLIRPRAGR